MSRKKTHQNIPIMLEAVSEASYTTVVTDLLLVAKCSDGTINYSVHSEDPMAFISDIRTVQIRMQADPYSDGDSF